jgi:hypothetical protein
MTEYVSITRILKETTHSVDFGGVDDSYDGDSTAFWQDIIATKSADTGFGHLVDSILEHGFDPDGAIGWEGDCSHYVDGGGAAINEGHHRLVAAILLCMDEVPTTPYGGQSFITGQLLSAHYDYDDPYPISVET